MKKITITLDELVKNFAKYHEAEFGSVANITNTSIAEYFANDRLIACVASTVGIDEDELYNAIVEIFKSASA